MMAPDAGLVAERDRLVGEYFAKRPPWWRVFARRRWRARLAALRAMNVSTMTALLRQLYPPDIVEQMASAHSSILGQIAKQHDAAIAYLITVETDE